MQLVYDVSGDLYNICFKSLENDFVNLDGEIIEEGELISYCDLGYFNDQTFDGYTHTLKLLVNENDFDWMPTNGELKMLLAHVTRDNYLYLSLIHI